MRTLIYRRVQSYNIVSYLIIEPELNNQIKDIKQQNYQSLPQLMYKSPYLRGHSANKLPPILKLKASSNSRRRQRIKDIDLSLQLLKQNSRPRILSNGSNQILKKQTKIQVKKASSSRRRTDSMVAQIQQKLSSFQGHSPSLGGDTNPQITLQNFHRNVKLNKEYIHREIKRRRQQKQKQSKQNEQLFKQKQYQQKQYVHKTQRSSSKKGRIKSQSDSQETAIFSEIQQILNSKIVKNQNVQKIEKQKQKQKYKEKVDLNQVRHLIKMNKINKNIRKLSPKDVKAQMVDNYASPVNNSSRVVLKDENNYHEWRRVDISPGENSPSYKQSTYELQNQRLQQFVIKNQISLSKYLQYRKQLYLCQSTKIKTSIC